MLTLPRDDLEKVTILEQVAVKFEFDKNYPEDEVNEIIKSCDVDDYVLFRRELLNFGFFGKNSYEGYYWVKAHKLSEEQMSAIANRQKALLDMED